MNNTIVVVFFDKRFYFVCHRESIEYTRTLIIFRGKMFHILQNSNSFNINPIFHTHVINVHAIRVRVHSCIFLELIKYTQLKLLCTRIKFSTQLFEYMVPFKSIKDITMYLSFNIV